MSGRAMIVIGIIVLLVAGGAILYVLLQSDGAVMTDGPGMLYFYSPIWPICQSMKPIVNRLEETYGDEFNIVRIDVTKPSGENAARELGLAGQPYYVFFGSANEETRRIGGPQTYEVLAQEIEMTMER